MPFARARAVNSTSTSASISSRSSRGSIARRSARGRSGEGMSLRVLHCRRVRHRVGADGWNRREAYSGQRTTTAVR
jgi:hypothetical protein